MLPASRNLPLEWGNDKNIKWTAAFEGTGYSSPVVWGDRVIITSAVGEKVNPVPERGPVQGPPQQGGPGAQPGQMSQPGQGPQPGQMPQAGQGPQPGQPGPQPEIRDTTYKQELYRLEVICFDLNTGNEIWKKIAYRGSPKAGKNPNSTYACETPVTDGKVIVASFGMNGLFCYDMNGNLLWQKEFGPYYTQRGWGTGSSPIIYNNVVYIQFDNEENSFLAALAAATGVENWRAQREEKTTYSTPYIWKNSIRTELVTGGKTARSYDPLTGKLLWELKVGGEQVIPSPVGNKEYLYLGNPGGREIKPVFFAVKAGQDGLINDSGIIWKSEETGLGNSSPLLYDGFLYIIGNRGEITVLDPASGKVKYQKRITGIVGCWASPWAYDGKIYFTDENGVTRTFKAGETYEQLSENKLDGKFWSSVAVTGSGYIFKGTSKLYCIAQ